jgi:hypothetical protein
MLPFTKKEIALMKKLNTPAKAQDFLDSLKFNFEKQGRKTVETCKSPVLVLRTGSAHCLEGAILGAYILSLHGFPPLVLHQKAVRHDYDHTIAPFRVRGLWGALSKTNHNVLRYREPVYRSIRELIMSYFHEYYLNNGQKTLRQYSRPLNLNTFPKNWMLEDRDLWEIDKKLDKIKHYDILPKTYIKKLRRADKVEIEAGRIVEYKPPR